MCLIRLLTKKQKQKTKNEERDNSSEDSTETDDLVSGLTLGSGLAHVIYLPLEACFFFILYTRSPHGHRIRFFFPRQYAVAMCCRLCHIWLVSSLQINKSFGVK